MSMGANPGSREPSPSCTGLGPSGFDPERGWCILLDPLKGGYVEGFDRDKVYEFRRGQDGPIAQFRLSSQDDYFNVAGLYWREIQLGTDPVADGTRQLARELRGLGGI